MHTGHSRRSLFLQSNLAPCCEGPGEVKEQAVRAMYVNESRLVWQVARAGDLADWLVRKSMMHPAMRDVPVRFDMTMGGWPDPTTRGTAGSFEPLTLQLQRAAYRRAITLVQCASIPPRCPGPMVT